MLEKIVKTVSDFFYWLRQIPDKLQKNRIPFLCVITPISDYMLEPYKGLVSDLKKQTNKDFINVAISNGESQEVEAYISRLRQKDQRFIYDYLPLVLTSENMAAGDEDELLSERGRRRNYAMKKYKAQRYIFLNADFQLTDNKFFARLMKVHKSTKKDVILASTNAQGSIYPQYPIVFGNIDFSNFSFSRKLAQKYQFPTDFDPDFPSNDYRFFIQICNITHMDDVFGNKEGRKPEKSRKYKF